MFFQIKSLVALQLTCRLKMLSPGQISENLGMPSCLLQFFEENKILLINLPGLDLFLFFFSEPEQVSA